MQTTRHFLLLGKFCLYQHSVSRWVADSDKTLFKFPIEWLQLGSQQLNALSRSGVRGAALTSFHQCFITYTGAENSTYVDSLSNTLTAVELLVSKAITESHLQLIHMPLDSILFFIKAYSGVQKSQRTPLLHCKKYILGRVTKGILLISKTSICSRLTQILTINTSISLCTL